MLHKSHISSIEIYSPEWDRARLGRFTSSKAYTLMGEKPYQQGFNTYVHQKAGELITGRHSAEEKEILEDENTAWGLQTEPEALNKFGVLMGLKYLVVQKMVFDPADCTSSTPDALWIIDSSVIKENCYNVATVEVKCPRTYHRFFPLFYCTTPEDLKKKYPNYFWQIIDQMSVCKASIGYFVCYHPLFPPHKNLRIIEFRKINLWPDFSLLEERKKLAIEMYKSLIEDFKA